MARGRKRTNTNRASLGGGYAVAPYSFVDMDISAELESIVAKSRKDTQGIDLRCMFVFSSFIFEESRWKSECQGWDEPYRGTPMPAARVSAHDISERAVIPESKARTFMRRAVSNGWLVVLKPSRGKGAGRGGTPATYTLPHLARRALEDKAGCADVGNDHEADHDEEDGAPMICLDASLLEPSRGSGGIDDGSTDE